MSFYGELDEGGSTSGSLLDTGPHQLVGFGRAWPLAGSLGQSARAIPQSFQRSSKLKRNAEVVSTNGVSEHPNQSSQFRD